MDCLFCKIINKQIPSSIIYEDENAIAFLDINPVNFGHTLVVPKKHSETLLETDDDVLCNLIPVVKKIGKALMKLEGVDAINIMVNNGETAGQVIFHTHIHIIPRISGDGFKHWHGDKYETDEQMNKIAEQIKTNLK